MFVFQCCFLRPCVLALSRQEHCHCARGRVQKWRETVNREIAREIARVIEIVVEKEIVRAPRLQRVAAMSALCLCSYLYLWVRQQKLGQMKQTSMSMRSQWRELATATW